MSGIDWSEALPGFDFHLQAKRDGDVGGFYKISKMKDRFESISGSYILFRDIPELADLFVINSRPAVQCWNGEGLPTTGVVCEVDGSPGVDGWGLCVIRYSSADVIVFKRDAYAFESFSCTESANTFRPMRTPEQNSAEARHQPRYQDQTAH